MKKKIIGGFVVAAIAALATFNINVNMSTHNGLSAVSLANVEALAQSEETKTKATVVPCHIYEDGVIVGMGNTCGGSNSNTCYSNPCI